MQGRTKPLSPYLDISQIGEKRRLSLERRKIFFPHSKRRGNI
jgi:hypothetical protein